MMRNTKTGGLEVYDIANNQITGAAFLGTVGLDWQVAGFGPISASGASDMVLRNVNTGAFEVYDIANNQITGAALLGTVGLDWQLGGSGDPIAFGASPSIPKWKTAAGRRCVAEGWIHASKVHTRSALRPRIHSAPGGPEAP